MRKKDKYKTHLEKKRRFVKERKNWFQLKNGTKQTNTRTQVEVGNCYKTKQNRNWEQYESENP